MSGAGAVYSNEAASAGGYGNVLNLGSPPARKREVVALARPRNYRETDQAGWGGVRPEHLSIQLLRTALQQATGGRLQSLGDLQDTMLATSPVLSGLMERHLIPGVLKRKWDIVPPPGGSSRAAECAAELKADLEHPYSGWNDFVRGAVWHDFRGGGFTENLWTKRGDHWAPAGFEPVPLQHSRYLQGSRELAFVPDLTKGTAYALSSYDIGTWSVFCRKGKADWSKRGLYRPLLTDWWQCIGGADAWFRTVRQFGRPPLDISSDAAGGDDGEDEEVTQMLRRWEATGALVHPKATVVKELATAVGKGARGSMFNEHETRCNRRAALLLVGATQSSFVEPEEGSQKSAGSQERVEEDVLRDHCTFVEQVADHDVFAPWQILNHGWESLADTPLLKYDFEKPVDVGKELSNFERADDLGLEVAESDVRKATRLRKPGPGEPTIRELRDARRKALEGEAPEDGKVRQFPAGGRRG